METVIVICLLIVIALLMQDKIVIKKRSEQKPTQEKTNPNLPDIMGQPKPIRSLSVTKCVTEIQKKEQQKETDNFGLDIGKKDIDIQIPQEELDEVFGNIPDLEEEEEEWYKYGEPNGDDGFATGVTFEELSTVGTLLQQDMLKPSQQQQQQAVDIVHKIQGTELFSLLENSMESASRKIAELLDSSLSSEMDSGSSTLRKNDLGDFDIGKFV